MAQSSDRPLSDHLSQRVWSDQDVDTTFGTPLDVNWLGLWTLYKKEVHRFFKVVTQTVLAPMATTLMFLAIFALALGRSDRQIGDLSFLEFLAPGLIMMAIVQNAFANTSSSIMIAKVQGNIVDYLMPPLSPKELVFGVIMGGVTRGVVVGAAVWLAMVFVVDIGVHSLPAIIFFTLAASVMLSLIGLIGALWAEKFDQMAALTNFVITPLSFLSGTFYSVEQLPNAFWLIAHINPFFYMIDGARYGFTGFSDTSPWIGVGVLLMVNVALWMGTLWLVRTGYRLRP
ncbi:MAG: ABC transporter permease [Geminicoccaceae bacterium]